MWLWFPLAPFGSTIDYLWNQSALFDAFLDGLSETLKDELAPLDLPADMDFLITLAIKINKCLMEREKRSCSYPSLQQRQQSSSSSSWRRFPSDDSAVPSSAPEEPMQLGRTRLYLEKRQRRVSEGRCLFCGQLGHYIATCRLKDQARQGR